MLRKRIKKGKKGSSGERSIGLKVLEKFNEKPAWLYGTDDYFPIRGLRAARTIIRIPKFFTNLAHNFRVKLNPRYADENYDTDIYTNIPLYEILEILKEWGCIINDPNQYWYPNQVASGHIHFVNGRQLHIRVYSHGNGVYSLKAHTEWDAMIRPIMHIMYAGLDYEKGYEILKKMWEESLKKRGIYDEQMRFHRMMKKKMKRRKAQDSEN